MNNKVKLIQRVGCIGLVSAMLVGCGGNTETKPQDNRDVAFKTVEGSVTVKRDKKNTKAKAKAEIKNGDTVTVKDDSEAVVTIDKDKFAYVEENTEFSITAKGNENDSQTTINLKEGAITSEIQNKLSKKSKFEIVTPSAKINVKGTIYRVNSIKDKDGVSRTYVHVFEGRVKITANDKEQYIEGGYQLEIDEKTGDFVRNDKGEVILESIDYKELPLDTLEYLLAMKEHSDRLDDFSKEDLEQWIEDKKKEENKEDNKEESTDKEENKEEKPNTDNSDKPAPEQGGNTSGNTGNTNTNQGNNQGGNQETTPPAGGSGGAGTGTGEDQGGGRPATPDYDPNYAATGGHPDDGVGGQWGKYFATEAEAIAFMDAQNDPNAPYAGWLLFINYNADGSCRVQGVKYY